MSKEISRFRPDWDDYFMAIAQVVSTRFTCDRLRAGAVIAKDNRIISTGYNGSPPHLEHCDDVGHLMEEGHCVRTTHAEHNALLQAAIVGGVSTKGSTLYTLTSPCIHCAKYVVTCGIKRVVTETVYRNAKVEEYFKEAGVEYVAYKHNSEWDKYLNKLFSGEVAVRPERDDVNDVELKVGK